MLYLSTKYGFFKSQKSFTLCLTRITSATKFRHAHFIQLQTMRHFWKSMGHHFYIDLFSEQFYFKNLKYSGSLTLPLIKLYQWMRKDARTTNALFSQSSGDGTTLHSPPPTISSMCCTQDSDLKGHQCLIQVARYHMRVSVAHLARRCSTALVSTSQLGIARSQEIRLSAMWTRSSP